MLQIWDTAGHERFRTITRMHYRGASGVIMVYDISNYSTFDSLQERLQNLKHNNDKPNFVQMLVGNKSDLEQLREVDASEAKSFADSQDFLTAVETSAKANTNIEDTFLKLATEMKKRFVDDGPIEPNPPPGLQLNGRSYKKGLLNCYC